MPVEEAFELIQQCSLNHVTVSVAESLTGGKLCSTLVDVPGASAVLLGGVCTYATELKAQILGVDPSLLQSFGPVDRRVAIQMARGVCELTGSDLGIATTGVAGPGPLGLHPAGTVHIACVMGAVECHRLFHFMGEREAVRNQSVSAALSLAHDVLHFARKHGND